MDEYAQAEHRFGANLIVDLASHTQTQIQLKSVPAQLARRGALVSGFDFNCGMLN